MGRVIFIIILASVVVIGLLAVAGFKRFMVFVKTGGGPIAIKLRGWLSYFTKRVYEEANEVIPDPPEDMDGDQDDKET